MANNEMADGVVDDIIHKRTRNIDVMQDHFLGKNLQLMRKNSMDK